MTAPAINTCLNFLANKNNVTGRKTKIENGQPRITPTAATATAIAGFSRRNRPDEREMAYIENELGKKPGKQHHEMIQEQNSTRKKHDNVMQKKLFN